MQVAALLTLVNPVYKFACNNLLPFASNAHSTTSHSLHAAKLSFSCARKPKRSSSPCSSCSRGRGSNTLANTRHNNLIQLVASLRANEQQTLRQQRSSNTSHNNEPLWAQTWRCLKPRNGCNFIFGQAATATATCNMLRLKSKWAATASNLRCHSLAVFICLHGQSDQ